MNSPRGIGLMKNYGMDCGETHRQPQLQLPASILLKSHPITPRDAITRFLNYNPNEENLSVILTENKYFAMIGKIQYPITRMIVFDTLLRCTEVGKLKVIPNRHGSCLLYTSDAAD